MDILQHGWGQIGLVILLQLLYLELSTVDCFAWHSPSETRSQTVPAQSHIISQRWPQSIPKWYPYNMWKKRKRKDSRELTADNTKRRHSTDGRFGEFMSKYQRLLDKLSRKKVVNSILRNDKWKHEGQSTIYGMSFHPPQSIPVLSTAKAVEASEEYTPGNHKSHFGNIGSVHGAFTTVKSDEDGKVSEEKKKIKESDNSDFSSDGFGKALSDGFGNDDGFQTTKPDDDFSGGFLSSSVRSSKVQHEADTAAKTSTGFATDSFGSDAGSWSDGSWTDTGSSWGGDGFGAMGTGAADSGSWGEPTQESGGFTSIGEGAFSDDTKDCDTILTKSCADNSECSCYGFYTCSGQRCQPIQSSGSSSGMGGQWQEGRANFGFSKRRDPGKVIQIFMLPWQPQK